MKKRQGFGLIIFVLVTAISGNIIFSNDGLYWDIYILASSFIIVTITSARLFLFSSFPFSLDNILNLFVFFFFGIAPALQFKMGVVLWANSSFTADQYFKLNVIIITVLNCYYYFYQVKISSLKISVSLVARLIQKTPQFYPSKSLLLFFSISASLVFLYSKGFSLPLVLFRSLSEDLIDDSMSVAKITSSVLIINTFIRPIPIVTLLLYKMYKMSKGLDLFELLLIFLALLTNAPTGMPRFMAAALYIPLTIVYIKFLRRKFMLSLAIIFGLLLVFPFLDQFRRYSGGLNFRFRPEIFLEGHFDAFQNFMGAISSGFVSFGYQLLGAIFFFIPRSIWPSKPVSSGRELANDLGYVYDNISMPYFAEGYVNFGIMGIFIFTFFIARFNASLDAFYWNADFETSRNRFSDKHQTIYYLLLLGMEFFVLRGALLSGIAYSSGLIAAAYVVNRFASEKIT